MVFNNHILQLLNLVENSPSPSEQVLINALPDFNWKKSYDKHGRLPAALVNEFKLQFRKSLFVKNLELEDQLFKIVREKSERKSRRMYLKDWKQFLKSNHINEGDICTFSFYNNKSLIVLDEVYNQNDKHGLKVWCSFGWLVFCSTLDKIKLGYC